MFDSRWFFVLNRKLMKIFHIVIRPRYINALIKCGVAPVYEHEKLLKYLNCDSIVDVGANRGQFALVARECLPNAMIYSFEPLPAPFHKIKCLFSDDNKVKIFHCAIGQSQKNMTMHVSKSDDSSSLYPISRTQSILYPGTEEKETVQIALEKLNNFIKAEDLQGRSLLKIDVQGYELEVMKGSEEILCDFSYVYVECSFIELYIGQPLLYEIIKYMSDKGFGVYGAYNLNYDSSGVCVQGDFLFKNLSK